MPEFGFDNPVVSCPCDEIKRLMPIAMCRLQWVDEDDEGDEKEDFDMSGLQNMQNVRLCSLTCWFHASYVSLRFPRCLLPCKVMVLWQNCDAICPTQDDIMRCSSATACMSLPSFDQVILLPVMLCAATEGRSQQRTAELVEAAALH